MKKGSLFGGFWNFAEKYCDYQETRWGKDFSGIANERELHNKLQYMMVRRLKKNILSELPPKQHVRLDVNNLDLTDYYEVEENFRRWIASKNKKWPGRAEVVVQIEYLKQALAKAKISAVKAWIKDYTEATNDKAVIFAHHKSMQSAIYNSMRAKAIKIQSGRDQDKINEFRTGPKQFAVMSMMAGGIGINLFEANVALFPELAWTPDTHIQAEDRLHRIGQKKQVVIYIMVAKNTIDEKIFELLKLKEAGISSILDDGEVVVSDTNIVSELWVEYGGDVVEKRVVVPDNEKCVRWE